MIAGDNAKNRILVVDDGVPNLRIAESHLTQQGYLVSTAQSGEVALELVLSNEFDLILLDVMMPGMDGFEVCRRLKADKQTKEIPVLFLTVLSDIDDIVNGFEVGGVDYITKPFNSLELIARVRAHLEYRLSRKQLLRVNRRLMTTEQDLLTLLEAVHSGILIVDPDDNCIVDINSAALSVLEQPLDQLVGHNYTELFRNVDDENNVLSASDCDLFAMEAKLITNDGRQYDVIQKVTEVDTSEKVYYLVNFIDITDRKHIELLREDISRIIQHDLKGPLNAIVALPEIIKGNSPIKNEDAQLLTLIEEAGYQMLNMINLSLDMYKMECRTYELNPVPVSILDVIKRIFSEQQVYSDEKSFAYQLLVDGVGADDVESIFIDSEDLLCYSMLSNLVKNAAEATPDGHDVIVEVLCGDPLQIVIRNHGAVPHEIRDSFFEKYSTSGKRKGTGLGTYSAQLIANTLGGSIFMDTSDDEGTIVTVELPILE